MKKVIILLVLSFFLLSLVFFGAIQLSRKNIRKAFSGKSNETVSGMTINEELPIIIAKDSFYDQELLFSSIEKMKKDKPRNDIYAIISPHHFVAADLIAEIVNSASGRNVKTVAIIGPNHENIGNEIMMSAKVSWQTPFGTIGVDEQLVDRFLADFDTTNSPEIFENEHSIGAIIPFVKNYFPQAKIVPIVLNSYAGLKEAEEISQWLGENLNKDGLVIFSTDFSHYLTKEEADKMDQISKQVILDRDIEKSARLTNDNLDCPAGLAASLLYAQKGKLSTEIVRGGNSFDFMKEKPSSTTSYLTIRFVK